MWKGYEVHPIWEKGVKLLAGAIILAAWSLLAWRIGEWIAHAFKGMFL
jgi:hypothetical protein